MTQGDTTIRLQVGRARPRDQGRAGARVGRRAFQVLGLKQGDLVEVRGTHYTGVRVLPPHPEDRALDVIRLDGLQRANLDGGIGDLVTVRKIHPPEAKRVRLVPLGRGSTLPGDPTQLRSLLLHRPLAPSEVLAVLPPSTRGSSREGSPPPAGGTRGSSPHPLGERRFLVVETEPRGIVVVKEGTEVQLGRAPSSAKPGAKGSAPPAPRRPVDVTYDDLGGVEEAVEQIREMVELPLKHPDLFRHLGIAPPRGVLLHGPPGTGKTLLARATANETGVNFLHVAGPEIMGRYYGESEERLREVFRKAREGGPSLIFIDEIDSIAPKREGPLGEVERRVVAQLLALMDGLDSPEDVVVLAATNRLDALDEALRRPGRFDREVTVGAPDRKGRREILEIHSRGIPLEDVDLDELAGTTHGFVGADLASLVREAVLEGLRRSLREEAPEDDRAIVRLTGSIRITEGDFQAARGRVNPSALREIHVEVAEVGWDDVAGLEEVKRTLREGVELPLKHPEAFRRLSIRPSRGYLLFGPPGTGKTLLGRAVAREAEANFILARASTILSRWYGESERQVSRIFARARQVAPAVIFLDEVDALAPRRQERPGEPVATERIVNTLLSEMDGMEATEGVIVVAATNRPTLLDPALLRPGRFDELLHVAVPHRNARLQILQVHTRKMPLEEDVDLESLADQTEGYTGADLEDLVRRAGIGALRERPETERIPGLFFGRALKESGPSITPEVEEEYEEIARILREDRVRSRGRIGFSPQPGSGAEKPHGDPFEPGG